MPRGYNSRALNEFGYSYGHVGKLLTLYSQEIASKIVGILRTKKGGLKPAGIRRELGGDIKGFVVSRVLGYLKEERIVEFEGGKYALRNDFIYQILADINLASRQKPKKEDALIVRGNAEVFNSLFFDRVNNVLIHMLLQDGKTFNDILRGYTNNHGYVAPTTLRYHLDKSISVYGEETPLFEFKEGKYYVSQRIQKLHSVFDGFIDGYDKDIELRTKRLWDSKIGDLANRDNDMISLTDPINKIIHMLRHTKVIVVMSSKPEGIISMSSFMNMMGKHLEEGATFSKLQAKDLMRPITEGEIISGETVLLELFSRSKRFNNTHYIVDLGDGTYGLLDLYRLVRQLPDI
jgi:hypothetical protein